MASPGRKALDELKDVQKFLETQQKLMGTAGLDQQVSVWKAKIEHLALDAPLGTEFIETIKMGSWSKTQQDTLAMAVNTSVLKANSGSTTQRRALQDASDFSGYFSAKDLQVIGNPQVPTQHKLEQIAMRMMRVGLHLPSEPTTRHILALAIRAGLQHTQNDHQELFRLYKELKRILKASLKSAPKSTEHLLKYPADPQELPPALLDGAFDADDPPAKIDANYADVAAQASSISCRRLNRLVSAKSSDQVAIANAQGSSSSSGQTGSGGMDPSMMMFQFMHHMMGMMGQYGGGQRGDVPPLSFLKPSANKRKALADGVCSDGTSPEQQTPPGRKEDSPGTSSREPDPSPKGSPSPPLLSPTQHANTGEELKTPPPKALTVPALPPDQQIATFAAAVSARQEAKKEVKNAGDTFEEVAPGDSKPKAKAKAKTKAKAKPKGKGKAKSAPSKHEAQQTKVPADAEASASAKGPPAKKAKVVSKEERVIYDLQNKPPCMQPGDPTVWYLGGKIHRNGNGQDFRVFLRCKDRNDRKVKVGSSPEESWQKCLEMIEKATDDAKDVD